MRRLRPASDLVICCWQSEIHMNYAQTTLWDYYRNPVDPVAINRFPVFAWGSVDSGQRLPRLSDAERDTVDEELQRRTQENARDLMGI